MLILMHSEARSEDRAQLMELLCRIMGSHQPITTASVDGQEIIALDGKQLNSETCLLLSQQEAVERIVMLKTPYKLVSKVLKAEQTAVQVGQRGHSTIVTIGGPAATPIIIAGPCAVESREQVLTTARAVKAAGANMLRGGAFKPRSSPYQFQGLGVEGLRLLAEAREETGLPVITEVMEPELVETVAYYADILQIGTRNMQNFPLLLAAGRNSLGRPVMLKRGLSATIEEWLLAAEYIVSAGNPQVILCERGIRSFDSQTRNVLDLACVPLLHELTHLPVIVDPSHATGRSELVPTMARAAIAAGAEGLILEVHPSPEFALCDGRQSITVEQLQSIIREMQLISQIMRARTELSAVA